MFGRQRHGGDVGVPALFHASRPGAFPVRLLVDHSQVRACAVYEKRPYVTAAVLGDRTQTGRAVAGILSRDQPQGGSEIACILEHVWIAHARDQRCRSLRPDCFDLHQPTCGLAQVGKLTDSQVILTDALVELANLIEQLSQHLACERRQPLLGILEDSAAGRW